jgi:hypothetical protein
MAKQLIIDTIRIRSFACLDVAVHMAEEIHQPERMIPLSILATVGIGLVSSLGYSIAVFFSMTDLEGITSTATGVPILELYHQATRSVAGAIILQVLIVLTGLGCLTACRECDRPLPGSFSLIPARLQILGRRGLRGHLPATEVCPGLGTGLSCTPSLVQNSYIRGLFFLLTRICSQRCSPQRAYYELRLGCRARLLVHRIVDRVQQVSQVQKVSHSRSNRYY